jgi:hypothetical protein
LAVAAATFLVRAHVWSGTSPGRGSCSCPWSKEGAAMMVASTIIPGRIRSPRSSNTVPASSNSTGQLVLLQPLAEVRHRRRVGDCRYRLGRSRARLGYRRACSPVPRQPACTTAAESRAAASVPASRRPTALALRTERPRASDQPRPGHHLLMPRWRKRDNPAACRHQSGCRDPRPKTITTRPLFPPSCSSREKLPCRCFPDPIDHKVLPGPSTCRRGLVQRFPK